MSSAAVPITTQDWAELCGVSRLRSGGDFTICRAKFPTSGDDCKITWSCFCEFPSEGTTYNISMLCHINITIGVRERELIR